MYIPTTSDIINQRILSMLMSGEFKPGDKINIDELSTIFEISKTPIREVLKKLEIEGLLDYYPRIGWEVKKFTKEQYFEAVELQELLECHICSNIGPYIDNIDFDFLEKVHYEIGEVIKNNEFEKILELNERFHLIIYDAYPNMKILDTLQIVWNSIRIQRNIMVKYPDFIEKLMEEHNNIIKVLKNRDIDSLVKSCRKHFETGKNSLNKYYENAEQN